MKSLKFMLLCLAVASLSMSCQQNLDKTNSDQENVAPSNSDTNNYPLDKSNPDGMDDSMRGGENPEK